MIKTAAAPRISSEIRTSQYEVHSHVSICPCLITFLSLSVRPHSAALQEFSQLQMGGYSNRVLWFVFKCSLSQSWRKFRRNGYICISKTSSGTAWWSPGGYSRAVSMTSVNILCFFYSLLFFFSILNVFLPGSYSDLPQQLSSNHRRSWPHHVSPNCLNHKHFHGVFFSDFLLFMTVFKSVVATFLACCIIIAANCLEVFLIVLDVLLWHYTVYTILLGCIHVG